MQSISRIPGPEDGVKNELKLKCYACEATFGNEEALRNHKIQMREEEYRNELYLTHIYCHYCDQDFMTERAGKSHWDQNHAEKQDINCPGCNMHFVQFSAFVYHVEFHECPVIHQETAAARCQKELDFARALERIDRMSRGMTRSKDFTIYLDGDHRDDPTNHLPARPAITNGPSDTWPCENPWALSHTQAPNAPSSLDSTQEQMMELQLSENREDESEWQRQEKAMTRARGVVQADPDDPKGRDFDPKRLFCPYTKMYKCPRCKKGKFKSWPALKQHLESAAHAFTKTVACPGCKDTFKHLFALAAHVESADKKCNLKHSDIFEIFLGQLTWNLVEVAGEHKSDGTTKFAISKRAEQEYRIARPAQLQLPFSPHQVFASEPGTARLQLTSRALSQLDKQPDQPLPQFNAPQQQSPPLHQGPKPQQACVQTRSVQNQAQTQAQRSQAQYQYQQQYPSLLERQQSEGSQVQTQARYQPRPNAWEQPQARMPQAPQQPARSLGSGLTELALTQVPAFPSKKHASSEEAWSNDGDGDAGW